MSSGLIESNGAREAAPNSSLITRPRIAVAVLFVVNLVGYLDRQVISLLVAPIKASLRLSDGEVGLMLGPAFIAAYSLAGLYLGRLVDRRNRRNLLLVCVSVWSLSAAAGGLASNALQLFIARMGVGIGEAALLPSALSIISDYFDARRRGAALGFFSTGLYIGAGLSLTLIAISLPFLNHLSALLADRAVVIEAWRLVMYAMLVPGLICCALLLIMTEPSRSSSPAKARDGNWPGIIFWWRARATFLPHHLGFSLLTICAHGMLGWFPTILIREFNLGARESGLIYGSLVTVVGAGAAYLGGVLGDRSGRGHSPDSRLKVSLRCLPIALFGFCSIIFFHSITGLLLGAVLVTAGCGMALIIGLLSLADLAPSSDRGQVTSIYLTFTGLLGSAVAPALVGYCNDLFGGAAWPLSKILAVIGILGCVLGGLLIALAYSRIRGERSS